MFLDTSNKLNISIFFFPYINSLDKKNMNIHLFSVLDRICIKNIESIELLLYLLEDFRLIVFQRLTKCTSLNKT